MKGLLLKDWYMMKQYCKYHLVCVIGFTLLSIMSSGNMFFIFYPCLLCGMIPVSLIGYDERSRWMQYSGTLPYTKAQIVSGKYLVGLLSQLTLLLVMGAAQALKMMVDGEFIFNKIAVILLMMLIISSFASSLSLPFIFKLGVEKGRTAYYLMVGIVCGASIVATGYIKGELGMQIKPNTVLAALAVIGMVIYILSWYISIIFYQKREIQ